MEAVIEEFVWLSELGWISNFVTRGQWVGMVLGQPGGPVEALHGEVMKWVTGTGLRV